MKYCIASLYLIFNTLFGTTLNAQSNTQFIINGTLKNCSDSISTVYVIYESNGQTAVDSSVVKEGRYQLIGNLDANTNSFAAIFANKPNIHTYKTLKVVSFPGITSRLKKTGILFIEPGVQSISHVNSFLDFRVQGSKASEEYEIITEAMKMYREKYSSLIERYSQSAAKNDIPLSKKLSSEIKRNDSARNEEVYKKYLMERAHSPIALYVLQKYIHNHVYDYSTIEPLFHRLSESQRNSDIGKRIESKIHADKKKTIGAIAMDFTQDNPAGQPVSLDSFRGKYVLLDFWASWCVPCRVESPYLVTAYGKYNNKGFEILSVSLDNNKKKWLEAIEADGLKWAHVSDLGYWQNKVALLYNIEAVPSNFLIDPKGIIIARNLRGEALERKLEEILGKGK